MMKLTNEELKKLHRNFRSGEHPPFINLVDENVEMFTSMIEEILEARNVEIDHLVLIKKVPKTSPNSELYRKEFSKKFFNEDEIEFGLFVEKDDEIGAANYSFGYEEKDEEEIEVLTIHHFISLEPMNENGRKMIDYLLSLSDVQKIVGRSTIDKEAFWKSIGAEFDEKQEELSTKSFYFLKGRG